ncbi:hypothetical protein N9772_06635, partial [Bacteroidia bacterium]|nr:hypothetical protein [Bacteroidia bacterium]
FEFYKILNEIKANPSLAVDSKITFNTDLSAERRVTIDRGDNAEYRFVINLGGEGVTLREADFDPTNSYKVVFADEYEDESTNLRKWGFVILKK